MQFEDGELASFAPIENTREGWLELLAVLPPEAEIALEVSTSGYFAMSVLEEAGWRERAPWVHTAGIDPSADGRKQKTDRLDARRLARKLSVADRDPLPEAWFPPRDIRELRLRARQRCWLAVLRAQGYAVHIFFLWVPQAELSLSRIRDRVLEGGHNVPEPIVRRR
jgi:hypothetical protein